MEQSLLEKLEVAQLVNKFPAFYAARRFTTVPQEPATGTLPQPVYQVHTLIHKKLK
jgi:hypothetical protein